MSFHLKFWGSCFTPAVDACGEGPKGHDGSAAQQGLDFIEEADYLSL
jgi:hypothetical protein